MVKFAESTKCKDYVNAVEMTRIMDRCYTLIEVVKNLVQVLPSIDWTVDIEALKIDVDDIFPEFAILGEPYDNLGRFRNGTQERKCVWRVACGRLAMYGNSNPMSRVTGSGNLKFR